MTPTHLASRLTLPIAALVGAESAVGVFVPSTYSREAPLWAAQGIGQDAINLVIVAPVLSALLVPLRGGSVRAWLVWLGVMIYLVYSYVLYAFFVHFGPLFLPYVVTLGVAFYGFWGSILLARPNDLDERLKGVVGRLEAKYLIGLGGLFALLWISDIVLALVHGQLPASAASVGFIVNPIHVLDLALLLPALVITGVLLRRGAIYGRLFAVPLLTFSVAMGLALMGMSAAMMWRGLTTSIGMGLGSVALSAVSAVLAWQLLRRIPVS